MAGWVKRKGGKVIGSSSHASKQMGLTRDLQNLMVEMRISWLRKLRDK
jgi:hypothetical protein